MAELEKIKTGLECCAIGAECDHCPYAQMNESKHDFTGCHQLHWDALELLKKKQPKKGEWIEREDANGDLYYDCSVCGESWVLIDGTPKENGMDYCPHCGADMRNGGDGE